MEGEVPCIPCSSEMVREVTFVYLLYFCLLSLLFFNPSLFWVLCVPPSKGCPVTIRVSAVRSTPSKPDWGGSGRPVMRSLTLETRGSWCVRPPVRVIARRSTISSRSQRNPWDALVPSHTHSVFSCSNPCSIFLHLGMWYKNWHVKNLFKSVQACRLGCWT